MANNKLVKNNRIILIDDNLNIHDDFRKALCHDDDEYDKKLIKLEDLIYADVQDKQAIINPKEDESTNPQYEISYATQGQEGYEKIVEAYQLGKPYSIAFIDIRMPPGWMA